MCVRVRVCACVSVCVQEYWLKGGVAMGVTYCKKVHNFQVYPQTCGRFSGTIDYEPKDS